MTVPKIGPHSMKKQVAVGAERPLVSEWSPATNTVPNAAMPMIG